MSDPAAPSKRDVLAAILARGDAYLHLDARKAGVRVPEWLADDPNLCLQIGYEMPVPIPDLELADAGVRATLSFRRQAFPCFVPWHAIFLIVDAESRGMLWEEDVPPETRIPAPRANAEPAPPAPEPLRRLRSLPRIEVEADADGNGHGHEPGNSEPAPPAAPAPGGEGDPEPPRPRPPHLRLVK